MTDTRAKPAPSGVQAACLRRSGSPSGTPLTIQRSGKTPPSAFNVSRAPGERTRVRQGRDQLCAPSGGKAIFNCALASAAKRLRHILAHMPQGRRQGTGPADQISRRAGSKIHAPPPSLAKASKRTGAAACRPARPNTGPLSGRPSQTAIVCALSKPIAKASR